MTQTIALSPSLCLVLPSGFLPQDKQPAPPTDNPAGSPQPRGPGQPGVAQDPAQKPPGQAAPCMDSTSIWMMVAMFAVFYFLLIRPQQQKMKQHRAMLSAIRRNDRVLTGGGIIGTVTKVVSDTEVIVEIAEGVRVRMARGTIAEVLSRTEPVAAAGGAGGSGGGEAKPAEQKPQGLAGLLSGLGLGGKK